jgi:TonB-dependent Receptor Plug Domain
MKTTRTVVFTLVAALASGPSLLAQTTTPAPTNAAPESEEVLQLSPFEVTADEDSGYVATSTLAGTRIRTDLRDVGSAISVITKEFMKDIGATDNSTLLQYTTNAEVAGTRGTYAGLGNGTSVDETGTLRAPGGAQRVRGLAAADNTRDFFTTDIPWDGYNVDRIDIQRGPNSILFGLGSPAGIVNASLNGASFRDRGGVEFRFGSYGSKRVSLDVNQVLIKDVLAVRLDGLWNHEKYQQSPAFQEDERIYGALRFDPKLFGPSFHTSIKLKYEHGDIDANRPRNIPPQDSITPWFRPINLDPNNMEGGMGKLSVPNGYTIGSAAANYSAWLGGLVNQQQPLWLIDGTSSQLYRIYGGYVNTGALNAAGNPQGASTSITGQRYADVFSNLTSFNSYANNARLTNYQYGQYRNMSLQDPSVFDFYNQLIDGPNKQEWEGWDAYNIDLSQTAFNDRLGVQLTYDRQKYDRGGEALLGNPTLNIDVLQNFQDYVTGPNNTSNPGVVNSNFGRPFVAGGPGRGNSYESDREYVRASLFGELRAGDFLDRDGLLTKILGKHRFNGVYSGEKYNTENRSWQMYANSAAYAAYKLQGNPDGITNLPPVAVIYLGPSLASANTAAGAYIPGIASNVTLEDGNIYQFASTWLNPNGVNPSTPWNVPANLQSIFNGAPVINPTTGAVYPQLTEASNPANYVGWNSTFRNNLLRYDNGADPTLLTAATKSLRQTKSYAGSWQGFLWNDAIVATAGWRYDEVKSKSVTAKPLSGAANRGALNLDPTVYMLPAEFPATQIFKDHSTAGGVVVHLNKLFERDALPLNVSLSYNKSNNFQVTDLRRDIYGNSISNPTGETKEYGVLLGTKDGKYSLSVRKYETALAGASTPLDNSGIYGTIRDALNWRNIKTYYMSAYAWSTAGQTNLNPYTGQRYLWDPVYVSTTTGRPVASGNLASGPAGSRLETVAEANTRRDASIKAINDMQVWLADKGYFTAWNYGAGPTTQAALQTRGQYEASPILPNPASVYDYRTAPLLSGFAVTADTQSKGYEMEFTANPVPNWRIAINASKTTAVRTNVGGPVLDELVAYMDTLMAGPGGDLVRFNSDYSAGNELRQAWLPWRGQYTLLKLQESTAASELRKWRYNVVTNYTFREGFLKNVSVGGSYRWQDKVVIGYPVIPGTGGLASFDLSQPYYGPSEGSVDLWTGYERKINEKINWRIQLNIRNVGQGNGLIPISVQPDGRTWASVRIAPAQEWFVTNSFSF